ncbi:hypothetical protein RRG08_021112 [Elysia crispata]|uniref:Uncharacterized protein n=1 Tax=Elysia crispata TaxID=231223 RepID=A0AAE1DAA1_9GAST|nr:hypothetical protein RRG08_021112 [Elysia crispata]
MDVTPLCHVVLGNVLLTSSVLNLYSLQQAQPTPLFTRVSSHRQVFLRHPLLLTDTTHMHHALADTHFRLVSHPVISCIHTLLVSVSYSPVFPHTETHRGQTETATRRLAHPPKLTPDRPDLMTPLPLNCHLYCGQRRGGAFLGQKIGKIFPARNHTLHALLVGPEEDKAEKVCGKWAWQIKILEIKQA